ncbi:uncharacterized protein LOC111113200 isoform X2 [Crassostrea virginica]|nr:uncharacterized protein LOC111113200 isoform X2 [Crassostrea virginica]
MYLVFILGLIELTAAGQLCMNCKNLINPHECNLVTRCGDHEQCYMEQYLRHNLLWYDLGCKSNLICTAINAMSNGPPVPVVGRREVKVQKLASGDLDLDLEVEDDGRMPVCESCCNSTTCNNGGACGVSEFNYYNGQLCFKCDQQQTPEGCDQVALCDQDRYCYLHKKLSATGFSFVWESGCSETIQNCTMSIGTICSNCCKDNLCNNKCSIEKPHYQVITTTTTPEPTRTTTKATTTPPTTTTTPTTTTQAPRPPTVLSMVVHPTNYHYGGDVHIVCTVESNPPHSQLGWNMMTDPNHIPSNIHLDYGTNKVTINIKHLTDANIGDYQCFVQNSLGQDVQTFSLHPPK